MDAQYIWVPGLRLRVEKPPFGLLEVHIDECHEVTLATVKTLRGLVTSLRSAKTKVIACIPEDDEHKQARRLARLAGMRDMITTSKGRVYANL